MDLTLTPDQQALRQTLDDFLGKECPPERVRASEPLGFDADLWRQVVELGLPTIAVPEEQGGGGGGLADLAVAAEELGRFMAPVPLVEAAVANDLLGALAREGSEPAARLLDEAVGGNRLATVAVRPTRDGIARLVPAGAVADLLLALDGDRLVAVEGGASPGETAGALPNLGCSPLADRRVDGGDVTVLARGEAAAAAHRAAVRRAWALTAAALVGLGGRALDIGVEYVEQRRAFGVVIGTFQTIQHRLADTATLLDGAGLLAHEAAWATDRGLESAPELSTMALLFAAETAFKATSDSLHFHGGYGYTLEYDIQLYFRRAKAWPLVFGDPRPLYREVAELVAGRGEG